MKTPLLALRADASADIGLGHVMRCLTLGRAWRNIGGEVIFITATDDPALLRRIIGAGIELKTLNQSNPDSGDINNTLSYLSDFQDAWIVLDGYHFDARYQHKIKEAGFGLMVIDDYTQAHQPYADVLLNQNIDAEFLGYQCKPTTVKLLGTQYALISPEFLAWDKTTKHHPEVGKRILVTLGGSDPHNQTLKVIQALHQVDVPRLEVTIVLGRLNQHVDSIKSALRGLSPTFQIIVDSVDMPSIIAAADIAISAGGSTVWELALMGIPNIILVLAANQYRIATGLGMHRSALNLGWIDEVSEIQLAKALTDLAYNRPLRLEFSERARLLVDGKGSDRVVSLLPNLSH